MAKNKNKNKNKGSGSSKKGRGRKTVRYTLPNISSPAADFAKAVAYPFDPDSVGCRVPDPYSFPTTTAHLRGTMVLDPTTTSGTVCFFPSPLLSMYDLAGDLGNTTTTGSMVSFSGEAKCWHATDPTNLGAIMDTFRVCSWGIKVSNLQAELSATGRVIIAIVPMADTIPTYGELSNSASTPANLCHKFFADADSAINSSGILNMPSAIELTAGDMMRGDLEIAGSVVSAAFYNFKSTKDATAYSATYTTGDEVLIDGTGASTGSYKDLTRMLGGCAILVYYEGMPTGAPLLQFEYVYHLEGSPDVSVNAGVPISSAPRISHVGTTNDVERAMVVNNATSGMKWIDRGANFLNANKGTIMKGARTVAKVGAAFGMGGVPGALAALF